MDTAQLKEQPKSAVQIPTPPPADASKLVTRPTAPVEPIMSQPVPDATVNTTVVSQELMMQSGPTAGVSIAPEVAAAGVNEVSETITQHQLAPGVEAVGDAAEHPTGNGELVPIRREKIEEPIVDKQVKDEDLAGYFVDTTKSKIWRDIEIAKESILDRQN